MASIEYFNTQNPASIFKFIDPRSEVYWDAFRATIGELFRNGWKFNVVDDFSTFGRIICGKKGDIKFWSNPISEQIFYNQHFQVGSKEYIPLYVHGYIANNILINIPMPPTAVIKDIEIGKLLNPHNIFDEYYQWAVFKDTSDQIVVAELSVLELLEKIKEKQLPKAKELVQGKIKEKVRIYIPGD